MLERIWTMASIAALAAHPRAAFAQQSVLTLPFYGYDTQSIDASVVAADSHATTLHLNCPPGTDGNDCGLAPYQTLTLGPSTYHMIMSEGPGGFTATQDCSTAGTTRAVCRESANSLGNFPGSSTATYAASAVEVLPVTITAGVEKLSAGGGELTSSAEVTVLSGTVTPTTTAATDASGLSPTDAAAASSTSGAAQVNARSDFGVVAMAAGILAWVL